jgi:hypothetical protein
MRLASATISSALLFSRLNGLFGHGEVEPSERIDALHPFPTGQTSILPYSQLLSFFASIALTRRPFDDDRTFGVLEIGRGGCFSVYSDHSLDATNLPAVRLLAPPAASDTAAGANIQ